MAAPHVSAVAALVLQASPALTPEEVKEVVLGSADLGAAFDGVSVSGARLNAAAAVQLALDGTALPDGDGDGWANAADACSTEPVLGSPDGCPLDDDWDGRLNGSDNCITAPNPDQSNLDRDAWGDACDSDRDGDGQPNSSDPCPNDAANGCVAAPVYTPPPVYNPPPVYDPPPDYQPPADRDGDGRADASDGCPSEPAWSNDGCPVPALESLRAERRRKTLTIRLGADRAATFRVTVQRRKRGRWVRVTRKTVASESGRVKIKIRRARKGRYRAVVKLSSSAGSAKARRVGFRVR